MDDQRHERNADFSKPKVWINNLRNLNTDFPFTLEMSYTASGNIATKNVTADILSADNTVSQTAYEGNYTFNTGQSHTIATITGTGIDQAFSWDLNGNLSTHTDNIKSLNRYLCWDEENHEECRTRNIEHRFLKYL